MNKIERQYQIIRLIATSPWSYTTQGLAQELAVSESNVIRDLKEMTSNGYIFMKTLREGYLQQAGWDRLHPIKDSTIRQMEILRLVGACKQGMKTGEIQLRLCKNNEISIKTIERDLRVLGTKHLIFYTEGVWRLNNQQVLPPLQLDGAERRLLMKALTLQTEMSPRKDEAKSIAAKLLGSFDIASGKTETLIVHGRTPLEDLRRNYCCHCLEEYARRSEKIKLLYRRGDKGALEYEVTPLGIVYYWGLDNWYLLARDQKTPQVFKLI